MTGVHGETRGVAIVRAVCCVAGRGAASMSASAQPSAARTARSSGTTSSAFGWCVSPISEC
jgi:hypothetical protein